MADIKKINIQREILIQKCDFISNYSTFFHNNLNNKMLLLNLKEILLSPTPLMQSDKYEEVMDEIKSGKTINNNDANYQNALEVLFEIVYLIRAATISTSNKDNPHVEKIRLYVKYISTHNSGKIYYRQQNIITLNDDQLNKALDEISKEERQKQKIKSTIKRTQQ